VGSEYLRANIWRGPVAGDSAIRVVFAWCRIWTFGGRGRRLWSYGRVAS
jgi:hypothetical protein